MKTRSTLTILAALLGWTLASVNAHAQGNTIRQHAQAVKEKINAEYADLEALYKHLHANPELSYNEVKTAARLAKELRDLGFEVTEKVGGTGVVAVMKNGAGPVVLVRADMDGLPVTEQTGWPGASKVRVTTDEGVETGVMHACGHDTHMTSWIGVARLMAANKAKWSGTLVMIGQPAEERGCERRRTLRRLRLRDPQLPCQRLDPSCLGEDVRDLHGPSWWA